MDIHIKEIKMKKEKTNNPYSWDHINSEKYWEIMDVIDSDLSDIDKSAEICGIIEGCTGDDILNLPISEAKKKLEMLSFLNSFSLIKHYTPKNLMIDGQKYNVMSDMSKLNVSQFIDYENFIQQPFRENYDKILSIFVIPEKYKYNDGYDISKVQEMIRKKMSFREVQSLANFILVKFLKYFLNSLRFLTGRIKKMKEGEEKVRMEKRMEELRKKMEELICFRF